MSSYIHKTHSLNADLTKHKLHRFIFLFNNNYIWFVKICGLPYGLELIYNKVKKSNVQIFQPVSKNKLFKPLPELYMITQESEDIDLIINTIDFFNEGYIQLFAISDEKLIVKHEEERCIFNDNKENSVVIIDVVEDALSLNFVVNSEQCVEQVKEILKNWIV